MAGANPAAVAQALTNAYKAARVALLGGALVYSASNSLFTVEGGHRAVVFNRLVGIKEDIYEEGMHSYCYLLVLSLSSSYLSSSTYRAA